MKAMRKLILACTVFSAIACLTLVAQTQVTPLGELEIGSTSENQVKAGSGSTLNYSGAIGSGNWVAGMGSLSVGSDNQIGYNPANWWGSWYGHYSLAVGSGNIIQYSYAAAIGVNNYNSGDASLVVGSSNSIPFGGDDPTGSHSFISGASNYNAGSHYSIISGINNYSEYSDGNATFGRGLINIWNYCTLVGKYNAYVGGTNLLFVVGNGSGVSEAADERHNALEVYGDGSVIIPKRQGDVGMGRFGNGGADL